MRRHPGLLPRFLRDEGGATAPLIAISIAGLVGAGALAVDFARISALDTELQDAADHAALAAATQLTGDVATRCQRATDAANDFLTNNTRFANDGQGATADVAAVNFYAADEDDAKEPGAEVDCAEDDPATVKFVEVVIANRTANYSFVRAISQTADQNWDVASARAVAGLGSAICRVPPVMMCNPNGAGSFDPDAYRGVGLRLIQVQGGNSWAPGNFGYLDVGASNNGTPDQNQAMAMNATALSCVQADGAEVDPGAPATVLDALNVRFDIFANGFARNNCFPSGNCGSAMNTIKDVVRRTPATQNSCSVANNNNEWKLPENQADAYLPTDASGNDPVIRVMGLPRDTCHYLNNCPGGRLGNGGWRPDLYFQTNHASHGITAANWQAQTGLPANATRYDVYLWELENDMRVQASSTLRRSNGADITGGQFTNYGAPRCKAGVPASPDQPDRRVIALAVVNNCSALNGGSSTAEIGEWADVFLVEPSLNRGYTAANELYVEVIGKTRPAGDGENAQLVRRDRPYLVR